MAARKSTTSATGTLGQAGPGPTTLNYGPVDSGSAAGTQRVQMGGYAQDAGAAGRNEGEDARSESGMWGGAMEWAKGAGATLGAMEKRVWKAMGEK